MEVERGDKRKSATAMIKVLFVCLGNICRSPAAEAVFRALVKRDGLAGRVAVDSAATADYQIGRPPDPRALAAGRRRGYDLAGQRARQVRREDFAAFDHVFAMDRENLADLLAICPPARADRVALFLGAGMADRGGDVPDPYLAADPAAFDAMFALIESGCESLLRRHRARWASGAAH